MESARYLVVGNSCSSLVSLQPLMLAQLLIIIILILMASQVNVSVMI